MSNEQTSRGSTGKAGGGAPIGSTVTIIIAVVAVVVGFLILRNIADGDDDSSTNNGNGTAVTTPASGSNDLPVTQPSTDTASTAAGPSTTAAFVLDPAQTVIVANASGLSGAAGQYTKALGPPPTGLGFAVGPPTDATEKVAVSIVYFLPGGEAVAASVAQAMGSQQGSGVVTAPMPTPVPVKGGALSTGATVLVMLGTDLAGKALPVLAGTPVTTALPAAPIPTTTTAAG